MDNQMEFSAGTVDEAIEKGLKALGKTRDEVDIVVIDSGAKGIFGIGSRPASVSLKVKESAAKAPQSESSQTGRTVKPESDKISAKEISEELPGDVNEADTTEAESENEEEKTAGEELVDETALKATVTVVEDLIDKMHIKASVTGRIGKLETSGNQEMILVDIKGDDLSYLIGRHSETLNAFQYITSLIVGRELGHWVPMMIDVQGYRERRERQLRQMAIHMADQVTRSGRRISLEPMPGTERRIIHLALRDRNDIYTESVGEEPNRKVVIYPKN
ncbi:MAG TPA: RNA-binding cell elongation regulator Jag/EloR [Flexilinea sp.]|jgi:spoIIIJ-associated protein|nr:Jag N-terminal domain-containing protein [Flexilinea sp.]HNY94294.1 RNA-binding cell elongation regulator Jag/EloR [Flexilinea sp.]HOG22452.1 RNA-binding cell elongation regulator Jag/EloR [Flexilinea sp.]HQG89152.1 RNA-binding cell elongation regulator Jag/EloR [Flexilinea sp.]